MKLDCWSEPTTTESGQYKMTECDCTTPSGDGREWIEIARALTATDMSQRVSFRRVALWEHSDMFWGIGCPRNSYGRDDFSLIHRGEESVVLADQIMACLKEYGDPALFGEADPIAMGY